MIRGISQQRYLCMLKIMKNSLIFLVNTVSHYKWKLNF